MARIVRVGIRLHALKRKRSQSANTTRKTPRETGDVYGNLIRLIEFLCAKEQEKMLKTEGIFRKSGNIARQRDLRNRILTCRHLEFPLKETTTTTVEASSAKKIRRPTDEEPQFDASAFRVHDYASVLKSVLSDMQKPLLTSQLMPIYTSLANITEGTSSTDLLIVRAKQLAAVRLLCLILPYRNQRLLHRLLDLLTRTLQHSDTN